MKLTKIAFVVILVFLSACNSPAINASTPSAVPTGSSMSTYIPSQVPATSLPVTISSTQTINTSTPTVPEPTSTPITFEQWLVNTHPDPAVLDATEANFAKRLGIDRSAISLETKVVHGQNGDFAALVDKATNTPLFVTSTDKTGNLEWLPATSALRVFCQNFGIYCGISVEGSEPIDAVAYQDAVFSNFNLLTPDGAFSPASFKYWGDSLARKFTKWAKDANMRLRNISAFHVPDAPDYGDLSSKEKVDAFMRARLETMLDPAFIIPGGKTEVVIAHESTIQVYPDGSVHWVGDKKDNTHPGGEFPLFDVYGRDWPVVAYKLAYQIAKEKGLKVGGDVVFAFSDYDMLSNAKKTDQIALLMDKVEAAVSRDQGIPQNEVRITMIDQVHMHADQQNQRGWMGFFTEQIDPTLIDRNVKILAKYGDVEADEIDVSGTTEMGKKADGFAEFLDSYLRAGGKSFDIYQALQFGPNKPENISLFEKTTLQGTTAYKPTVVYWKILQVIWRIYGPGQRA